MNLRNRQFVLLCALWAFGTQHVFADSIAELRVEAETLQLPRAAALRLDESTDDIDRIPLDIEAQNSEMKVHIVSIKGQDVNGDGIRDDIERRISAKFFGPGNKERRAYALMAANRYQSILTTMLNPRSVYADLSDLQYIKACYSLRGNDAESDLEKLVLPWTINTLGRLRRYTQAVVTIDRSKVESKNCN